MDLLLLHPHDHFRQVGRGGWDARLGFEKQIDLKAETSPEVRPGIVVRHHLPALERRQKLFPLRELRIEFIGELLQVRLVGVAGFGVDFTKGLGEVNGDDARIDRVRHVVGIARGVNVPLGPVQRRGHFEELDALAAHDVRGGARLEPGVPRPLEQWREPADLQFRAALPEHLGRAEPPGETRLGVHEMRILGRTRQRRNVHLVAADGLGQGTEIRGRGDDLQPGLRQGRKQKQGQQQTRDAR